LEPWVPSDPAGDKPGTDPGPGTAAVGVASLNSSPGQDKSLGIRPGQDKSPSQAVRDSRLHPGEAAPIRPANADAADDDTRRIGFVDADATALLPKVPAVPLTGSVTTDPAPAPPSADKNGTDTPK